MSQGLELTLDSFRSTNSNAQDFIPHLRYTTNNKRNQTAREVRSRRDQWLATMLEGARESAGQQTAAKQTVATMLLSDNNEGLTERKSLSYGSVLSQASAAD